MVKPNIMKNLKVFIFCFLAMILSCNDDVNIETAPIPTTAVFNFEKGAAISRNFHGLVLDQSGNPISNATVSVGSTTVQTNAAGVFSINNAAVNEKFAHLKITKTGFIDGSRVLIPAAGENRVDFMLIPFTVIATVSSGATSEVSLSNGTKVKFSGGFKDAAGNAYSGFVQVGLFHLKPSNPYLKEIMPGSLLSIATNGEAKFLETLGMMHVELRGSAGQKLNLSAGTTAEVSVDIDAIQLATAPNSIPLWSFDENAGIWVQDGLATKVGTKYVGNVSHFSWWNCDQPFAQCTLITTVHNNTGSPILSLSVGIQRATAISPLFGTTNALGQCSGVVPANEPLLVVIKDFCGNTIYSNNIGPFAIGSTNTLPTIVLPAAAISTTVIAGILKTCSGVDVTNGMVKIKNINSSNYFGYIFQPISN